MNYNFKIISEQYPKSFEKLKELFIALNKDESDFREIVNDGGFRIFEDGAMGFPSGWEWSALVFNPLELTAFFDEQGIIGTISFNYEETFEEYKYEIAVKKENNLYDAVFIGYTFHTRELALAECWNKCFYVLEEILK